MSLNINVAKTKYLLISKKPNHDSKLFVGTEVVEKVDKFKYLGSWMNENGDHAQEIKVRIEMARSTFFKMSRVLCHRDLSLDLRLRIVRCPVFSVLLYGVETWTLTQHITKKLEAFEMWVYRRILKIPWSDRVTNIEVLNRLKKKTELINTIKRRKLSYFGHVMRNDKYRMLQLVIQGKIAGKRSVGRRRHSWLKNLREWFGCSTTSLFRAAASKVKIALMLSNLR
ncbi:hypothetical protein ABMA27_010472 [Loxostege sticticalis]|uniref:Endonuclease-reverse transcriptase n=1 Tax=Loxostege sticticalis TaxID=481309 RepID=A0ABR3H5T7_LOXSC